MSYLVLPAHVGLGIIMHLGYIIPVVTAMGGGGVQQKALVTQLLADHSTEQELKVREEVKQEIEPRIDQSDLWLVKYDELALKTHNIPLSHLSCCR